MTSHSLVLGHYDGLVCHLSLSLSLGTLSSLGETHSHQSAVRAASIHGNLSATGGVDDVIRLHTSSGHELGGLFDHEGSINSLSWHGDLLISGSSDHTIGIFRANKESCERLKLLHAHSSEVNDLSARNGLMLSCSNDRGLYLWDLGRGKVVFSGKTRESSRRVRWGDKNRYMIIGGKRVGIWSIENGEIDGWEDDEQVLCGEFVDKRLWWGGDGKVVNSWDEREGKKVCWGKMEKRVKEIGGIGEHGMVVVDGSGGIKVWDVRSSSEQILCKEETGGRVTCMGVQEGDEDETTVVDEDSKEQESRRNKKNRKKKTVDKVELKGTASQRKRKKRRMELQEKRI